MADQPAAVGLSGDAVDVLVHKHLRGKTVEALWKFWGEMGKQMILAHLEGVQAPMVQVAEYAHYARAWVPGETLETHLQAHPEEGPARADELLDLWATVAEAPSYGWSEEAPAYFARIMRDAPARVPWPEGQWEHARLLRAIAQLPPVVVPEGFSHGDLNFQNIIVGTDGTLHLIDPLLNPFDSPGWDLGKLLQSTYVNWPVLREGRVEPPAPYLVAMAERFLDGQRRIGLLFLFLVLLRILRHLSTEDQQRAVFTEALRVGWDYVYAS